MPMNRSNATRMQGSSVGLVRGPGMANQLIPVDQLKTFLVGCLKNDRRGDPRLACFVPAQRAQAPAIARVKTGKVVVRPRSDQVVTALESEVQEGFGDHCADGVRTVVIFSGLAKTIAVKAGTRVGAAKLQGGSRMFFSIMVVSCWAGGATGAAGGLARAAEASRWMHTTRVTTERSRL